MVSSSRKIYRRSRFAVKYTPKRERYITCSNKDATLTVILGTHCYEIYYSRLLVQLTFLLWNTNFFNSFPQVIFIIKCRWKCFDLKKTIIRYDKCATIMFFFNFTNCDCRCTKKKSPQVNEKLERIWQGRLFGIGCCNIVRSRMSENSFPCSVFRQGVVAFLRAPRKQ